MRIQFQLPTCIYVYIIIQSHRVVNRTIGPGKSGYLIKRFRCWSRIIRINRCWQRIYRRKGSKSIDSSAARNRPWRTLAFLPLLTSSLLTKIGSVYTQLLQKEKIFPMMPRSEWSAEWSLRYSQKCSKTWVKTQSKISCHYTCLLHAKSYPSRWHFLRSFLTTSKPNRSSITAAKRKEKEKREKRE